MLLGVEREYALGWRSGFGLAGKAMFLYVT
jgi:hypothetical protein